MKKNFIYGLLAAAALMTVGACSNETPLPGAGGDDSSNEDGVYMTVTFDMPTASGASRSYTNGDNSSNNGQEIGSEEENAVSDVVLVLANKNYSYIASAEITSNNISKVATSGRSYKSTTAFSKTEIFQYYDNNNSGDRDVYVFVFCNPTNTLKGILKDAKYGNNEWYNKIGEIDEKDSNHESIWTDNYFLMGNSALAVRTLPATKADWENYATESSPFNLSGFNSYGRPNEVDNYTNKGNVMVERAAARFDFRDGSVDGINNEDYNGIGNQTYQVLLDTEGHPLLNIKLGKMSLVNMNRKFYFLKRVSPNGLPENVALCGPELPWYSNALGAELPDDGNYVVDAEADWKSAKTLPNTGFSAKFNYPFFNENGKVDNADNVNDRWSTTLISKVLSDGQDDNPNNWNSENKFPSYKVWRYATENTIPGVETQKNAVSTGVVFKGQMLAAREASTADDEATKELLNALTIVSNENQSGMDEPKLYLFAGHLYCGWNNIRQMALSLAISDLKQVGDTWEYNVNRSGALYNAVFGTGGFGTLTYKYMDGGSSKEITLTDTPAEDETSANYKYKLWQNDKQDDAKYQAFKSAVVGAKITIYERSYDQQLGGWGYYCYYYYWNQHNNNGQPGVMGPMEFAVVRNNVYKLAVTKISRLGHPRITANDPDAPNPNTPDEKADIYITVTCTTLPWVVRLNDIEF